FPRFDRKDHWRISTRRLTWQDHDCDGRCDHENKVIRIFFKNTDRNDLDGVDKLLIHETCHAVTPGHGHGKTWRTRLRKAADKAIRLGRAPLAEQLQQEIAGYEKAEKDWPLEQASVYADVVDWLAECPRRTFDQIKLRVSYQYCLDESEVL